MKKIVEWIFNRYTLVVIGLLLFAVVVLLVGPLIAVGAYFPLESLLSRWLLIAAVVLIWIVKQLWDYWKQKKNTEAMGDALLTSQVSEEDSQSAEEVAQLKQRFEAAISTLRLQGGKKGRRASLYELPWYIFIGPPGSGKTTALINSGLHFPLADELGMEAVQGIGGTRNCDWWFTDQAVLIDTAGRYVTQDSQQQVDSSAWQGFLNLLKKYRKRRPLNGVFVAVSLKEILQFKDHERVAHVQALKRRIAELDEHFGIRFPIYVLVTKCDLVAGFSEYFADLSKEGREQVWGVTFPLQDASTGQSVVSGFRQEFDRLVQRLKERRFYRLQQERELSRCGRIINFPSQMVLAKDLLSSFLEEVFGGSRYEQTPMLRGVYFTSGTQEGTPIDRLVNSLSQNLQIPSPNVALRSGQGKSYFIKDVLERVAFAESELAGTNRRLERQRAWMQNASYGLMLLCFIGLLGGWLTSWINNTTYIEAVSLQASVADQKVRAIDHRDVNPLAVLDALNTARAVPGAVEGGAKHWQMGFGLFQGDKLGQQARAAYRRVLEEALLPRLMLHLERQIQQGGNQSDYLYVALKSYLMLEKPQHYDSSVIEAFFRLDWLQPLSVQISKQQHAELSSHLSSLFGSYPRSLPFPLDQELIAQVRSVLMRLLPHERVYARLVRVDYPDLPGFSIYKEAGGARANQVFLRFSGALLSTEIPGLFTRRGYLQVFSGESVKLTDELLREQWVIGDQQAELDSGKRQEIVEKVRERYLHDYAQRYTELLKDVDLAPFNTPQEAAHILSILVSDQSPLRLLIEAVKRETSLSVSAAAPGLVDKAESRVDEAQKRLTQLLGVKRVNTASSDLGLKLNPVDREFSAFNELVTSAEGKPVPLDGVLELLRELYRFMSTVALESTGGAIAPHVAESGQTLVKQLQISAQGQPELLVGDLLSKASERSAALAFGGIREHLNQRWKDEPLAFCRNAIQGRYPVGASTNAVIRLDDFGRFFGYGGLMDTFFDQHLRQFIDMSVSPWRLRRSQTVPVSLSVAAIAAFEKANAIKKAYFAFGSNTPKIRFSLLPVGMDKNLSLFVLNLEGQRLTYDFGPQVRSQLIWPGPNPDSEVRVEITKRDGSSRMLRTTGPWAWFRMMENANFGKTSRAEVYEMEFKVDNHRINYELTARSAFNPFKVTMLSNFRCPSSL